MFIKIIILSIRNNKLLINMQIIGIFLTCIILNFGFIDLYSNLPSQKKDKIIYILLNLFYYNICNTIIIIIMLLILINGYMYYISKRKSLFQTLYINGFFKKKISCFIILESTVIFLFPMLLSNLLYFLFCFLTSTNFTYSLFVLELFVLLLYEIIIGINYAKNHLKLL
ncbi:hypothetical protein SAMN04487772_11338 [[Clostridium] polysaccharolyticum]|uniref:FtsX-like permease family protein n=1 Tax=[Clostridium] polysaccharolyticum TaxID=29364 RepID=A0A1I0D9E5_9FIRM|nr:hypothetical protein SAMN04487772_11338 [[Clostridium] polysaccharolyticum]